MVAFCRTLTYRKLAKATGLIRKGVPYIATNPDVLFPVDKGYIPDTGAILALIKAATGVEPSAILGKPNMLMLEHALSMKGIKLEEAVLFGDRLHTDIEMANMAGITFVLVLTGETKSLNGDEPYRPDFVISSLKDIIEECKGR